MIDKNKIPEELLIILENNLKGRTEEFHFPPPVFEAMQGELINYDLQEKTIVIKYPILKEQLNPYGNMQGGIISAAIDNTIGPLSVLVAPPNFTRHMETKYAKIISPDLKHIFVSATFIKQKKRQLFFEAIIKDKMGNKLATAKTTNWIID